MDIARPTETATTNRASAAASQRTANALSITTGTGPSVVPAADSTPAVATPRRVPTRLEMGIRRSYTSTSQGLTKAGAKIKKAFTWPFAKTEASTAAQGAAAATSQLSISTPSSKLRDAVRRNNLPDVQTAIQNGAKSSAQSFGLSDRGYTALTTAASMLHLNPEIWMALIACGGLDEPMGTEPTFDIGMKREHRGDTALHQAVRHGNLTAVSKLLGAGANSALLNSAGVTPGQLAFARWKADPEDAANRELVGLLMSPNEFLTQVDFASPSIDQGRVHTTVKHFPAESFSTLTAANAQRLRPHLNAAQLEGAERLHTALINRDTSTINRLMNSGADRLVQNAAGVTAAQVAFDVFARTPHDKTCQRQAMQMLPLQEFLDCLERAVPRIAPEHVQSALSPLSADAFLALPPDLRSRLEPHLSNLQREISRNGDTALHAAIRTGDLPALLRMRGSPQGEMSLRNRSGASASALALQLLRLNPARDLHRRIVAEMVGADEIVDAMERPGAFDPNVRGNPFKEAAQAAIHLIPHRRLIELSPENLQRVWSHLRPEQHPGLKERDTQLHLAVRRRDLEAIGKKEFQSDRATANGKEGMTPVQLAFSLLREAPGDEVLQQAIVKLLPVAELAESVRASGLHPDVIRAVVTQIPRDELVAVTGEPIKTLRPYLSTTQVQMLKDRDTELHLAVRTGSAQQVDVLMFRGSNALAANAHGQTPLVAAFERLQAQPGDSVSQQIATRVISLSYLMGRVRNAGTFSSEVIASLIQTAPEWAARQLTAAELNNFGRLLSPAQLKDAVIHNPAMTGWVQSLGTEGLNGLSSAQLEAIRPAAADSQLLGFELPSFLPPSYVQPSDETTPTAGQRPAETQSSAAVLPSDQKPSA